MILLCTFEVTCHETILNCLFLGGGASLIPRPLPKSHLIGFKALYVGFGKVCP